MYHVLNRAVARLPLFEKRADYEAFVRVLAVAVEPPALWVLAYCVMPIFSYRKAARDPLLARASKVAMPFGTSTNLANARHL